MVFHMAFPSISFWYSSFKISSPDCDSRLPLSTFAYGLNKHDIFSASEKEEGVETEGWGLWLFTGKREGLHGVRQGRESGHGREQLSTKCLYRYFKMSNPCFNEFSDSQCELVCEK